MVEGKSKVERERERDVDGGKVEGRRGKSERKERRVGSRIKR